MAEANAVYQNRNERTKLLKQMKAIDIARKLTTKNMELQLKGVTKSCRNLENICKLLDMEKEIVLEKEFQDLLLNRQKNVSQFVYNDYSKNKLPNNDTYRHNVDFVREGQRRTKGMIVSKARVQDKQINQDENNPSAGPTSLLPPIAKDEPKNAQSGKDNSRLNLAYEANFSSPYDVPPNLPHIAQKPPTIPYYQILYTGHQNYLKFQKENVRSVSKQSGLIVTPGKHNFQRDELLNERHSNNKDRTASLDKKVGVFIARVTDWKKGRPAEQGKSSAPRGSLLFTSLIKQRIVPDDVAKTHRTSRI